MENTTNEYIQNDNERLVRPSFASIQKLEEALIVHCCFVQRIIVFYVDISSLLSVHVHLVEQNLSLAQCLPHKQVEDINGDQKELECDS